MYIIIGGKVWLSFPSINFEYTVFEMQVELDRLDKDKVREVNESAPHYLLLRYKPDYLIFNIVFFLPLIVLKEYFD